MSAAAAAAAAAAVDMCVQEVGPCSEHNTSSPLTTTAFRGLTCRWHSYPGLERFALRCTHPPPLQGLHI